MGVRKDIAHESPTLQVGVVRFLVVSLLLLTHYHKKNIQIYAFGDIARHFVCISRLNNSLNRSIDGLHWLLITFSVN